MSEIAHPAPDGWLKRFFLSLVILALLAGLLLVPWAVCWLTASGELDQEEVVARQAQGEFVLFGPGLAQDIMAYKLALYAAVKPEVVVLGSSRAGNVRAAFFERPFVNMAGAATDLESLRLLVDRMLAVHRPKVVLLGLDFWWLTAGAPAGRPERIVQPSLLDASTLRAPWRWLVQGRIAPADMLAPLQHRLRADRYGLEAQLRDTGYGPDGSPPACAGPCLCPHAARAGKRQRRLGREPCAGQGTSGSLCRDLLPPAFARHPHHRLPAAPGHARTGRPCRQERR